MKNMTLKVSIHTTKIITKTISIELPYYYKTSLSTDGGNAYDEDTYGCILKDTMIIIIHLDEYLAHKESYEFSKEEFVPENQASEKYFHPDYMIQKSEFEEAYKKMQVFLHTLPQTAELNI